MQNYFLVFSCFLGAIPVTWCIRHKLYIEGIVLGLAYSISIMFHLSQLGWFHLFLSTQNWRYVDNFFALTACAVVFFHLIPIQNILYKRALQTGFPFLIFIFGFNYLLSHWMKAILGIFIGITVIGKFIYEKKLPPYNYKKALSAIGLLIIAGSVSAVHHLYGKQANWFFHGVWHLLSAISIYLFLEARNYSSGNNISPK